MAATMPSPAGNRWDFEQRDHVVHSQPAGMSIMQNPSWKDAPPINDTDMEEYLSWTNGSVLMRTRGTHSKFCRYIFRDDLAIGIDLFEDRSSEVTWRLDGNLVLDKEGSPTAASHDLVVLPPRREFLGRARGRGQGLWLFIDPQMINDEWRMKSFTERATVDCSWSKDPLSWALVSEIRKECMNRFPRGPMFLERAAMVFVTELAYVLRCITPRFEPTHALCDSKLRMVIDYFECNLNRNITLSEVSALVELTPRYFCAAFKEATGRPPHQFQIERRVERAKALLRDPDLSLTDVARLVGFNSRSHLSDYFHRIAGVTPARYRAEVRPKMNARQFRGDYLISRLVVGVAD
jgi:AraC family transcriptional regulator